MARCKECLHYEVCAKEGRLVQVDEHTWDEYNKLDDVEQFCTNYFTTDVVPKSEVVKALNEVELLIIITKEAYKQQMEDAPNELSKQSKRTKWIAFEKFYEQFAELKKKYTESKNDGS